MNRRNFIKMSILAAMSVPVLAPATTFDNGLTEWQKCKRSPHYFINNYIYVSNPRGGKVLLHKYEFQDELLSDYLLHQRNVVVKSRQMGISSLTAAYALWEMIFGDKTANVLFVAPTMGQVDCLRRNVAFMYHNLPDWMKSPLTYDNRDFFVLQNGAKMSFKSSRSIKSMCGESLTLFVVDEAAFCEDMLDIWLSVWGCLGPTGRVIFYSSLSPNNNCVDEYDNEINWFHDLASRRKFVDANYIEIPWHRHPERDLSWKHEMQKLIGTKNFAREFECRFI